MVARTGVFFFCLELFFSRMDNHLLRSFVRTDGRQPCLSILRWGIPHFHCRDRPEYDVAAAAAAASVTSENNEMYYEYEQGISITLSTKLVVFFFVVVRGILLPLLLLLKRKPPKSRKGIIGHHVETRGGKAKVFFS